MKKLFGIFAIGAAALTLASCEEDPVDNDGDNTDGVTEVTVEDLPNLFASSFSGGNLIGDDGLGIGTYTFNADINDIYNGGYNHLELSASIHNTGILPSFDISLSNNSDSGNGVETAYANLIVDQFQDIYFKSISESEDGSSSIVEELVNGFEAFADLNPDDYDYAKFSADSLMTILPFFISDIAVDEGTGDDSLDILGLLSGFEYSIADFMIDDFTTYELVSQTEAYAIINFEPFNQVAYELVYDSLNFFAELTGEVLNEEEFNAQWSANAEEFGDLSIDFKLGINPTAGNIIYAGLDLTSVFAAFDDESSIKFEFIYDENGTGITVPTTGVLDANGAIDEIVAMMNYDLFVSDVYYFLSGNGFIYEQMNNAEGSDNNNSEYVIDEEKLTTIVDMSINDISKFYGSSLMIPDAWYNTLDLDKPVILTDGTNFYVDLYWVDGTAVFTDPVLINPYIDDFSNSLFLALITENFNTDYYLM